jgi:DEAD/DEAH box helicase domain-containing protein
VDNPPVDIFSKGLWIDIPKFALEILTEKRLNLAAGIHAAEHALMSLMPQYVISMPGDVRTECKNALKEFAKRETKRKRPARLTFYDAKGGAGGCGIAAKAFEFVDLLIHRAVERVLACHCEGGCTECICDERCKEKNMIMSKAGAEVILKSLIGMEIDIDALPMGEDEAVPAGVETVVFATEVMGKNGRRVLDKEYEYRDGKVIKMERDDDDIIVIKDEPED